MAFFYVRVSDARKIADDLGITVEGDMTDALWRTKVLLKIADAEKVDELRSAYYRVMGLTPP